MARRKKPRRAPSEQMTPMKLMRLKDRRKRPPRPGLWWKVFENDGRLAIFPKNDAMLAILTVAPLYALLRLAPVATHAQLVLPIVLILFSMGAGFALCSEAFLTTGPSMEFGWSALAWLFLMNDMSYQPGMGALITTVQSFAILLIVSFFTPALGRETGGTFALAFYASGLTWFCVRRYVTGFMDEATVRTYLGWMHLVMIAFALGCTALECFRLYKLRKKRPELARYDVMAPVLLLAGIVPLLVARVLAPLGSAACLAGATAAYVVLAVLGRLRSPRYLSWSLFALVLGATIGLVARADASALPVAALSEWLVSSCANNPLARLLADGALPLVDAFTSLMGGFVISSANAVFGFSAEAAKAMPGELVSALCLYPGVFGIASVMGVAVSVLEMVRPELVQRQLAEEAAELEAAEAEVAALLGTTAEGEAKEPQATEDVAESTAPRPTEDATTD